MDEQAEWWAERYGDWKPSSPAFTVERADEVSERNRQNRDYANAIRTAAAQLGCDPVGLAEAIRGGIIGRLFDGLDELYMDGLHMGHDGRAVHAEFNRIPPAKEATCDQ